MIHCVVLYWKFFFAYFTSLVWFQFLWLNTNFGLNSLVKSSRDQWSSICMFWQFSLVPYLLIRTPNGFIKLQSKHKSTFNSQKLSRPRNSSPLCWSWMLKSQILFLHFSPWKRNPCHLDLYTNHDSESETIEAQYFSSEALLSFDKQDLVASSIMKSVSTFGWHLKYFVKIGNFLTLTVLNGIRIIDAMSIAIRSIVAAHAVECGRAAGPRSPSVCVSICQRRLSAKRSVNASRCWAAGLDLFRVRVVSVSVKAASD